MPSIRAAAKGRPVAAVLAVLAVAFLVAATVKRSPPDFSVLPVIAVVCDSAQRPLWAIRLARPAHEIAVDSLGIEPPPVGSAYQLWLATPAGARSLGLLPVSGRKVLPEIPALAARLAGRGELMVTLEPARGADTAQPSGPVMFRAAFPMAASTTVSGAS
jgi:anti-sigma-K factor RskA